MKKLIALLNKYEQRKWEEYWRWNYVWWIDKENKNIFASRFPDWVYICEEESRAIIICKGYEFIKWLVDNYKIDFDKVIKNNYWNMSCLSDWIYDHDFLSNEIKTKYLLMILSIQDNPIEFLVSVLK